MKKRKNVVCIIPARYDSSRFPGKPLVRILNKPMIQWVYERALRAKGISAVAVATDDTRISHAVLAFGGSVVLTSRHHPSGTSRVAEAARKFSCDMVVNVQGDEPFMEPHVIEETVKALQKNPNFFVSTAAAPLKNPQALRDPNTVKVVLDKKGRALYFSRSPIPYLKSSSSWNDVSQSVLRHIGIYAFTKSFLLKLARFAPSPLEQAEQLEQLRVMENGHAIHVVRVAYDGVAVDTPLDLQKIKHYLSKSKNAFLFIACGGIVRIWATGHIQKIKKLATGGPYRFVRHPLYAGNFLIGFGFCVFSGKVVFWAVFFFLWILFYYPLVLEEEKFLMKTFSQYEAFMKIPRFIPTLSFLKNAEPASFYSFAQAKKNREPLTFIVVLLFYLLLGLYEQVLDFAF